MSDKAKNWGRENAPGQKSGAAGQANQKPEKALAVMIQRVCMKGLPLTNTPIHRGVCCALDPFPTVSTVSWSSCIGAADSRVSQLFLTFIKAAAVDAG